MLRNKKYKTNVKPDYTIGDDIISAEINGKEHYYVYDGHGDVRYLADDKGSFTDSYSYDAYGVLIKKIGDTENDFLYYL